VFAGGLLTPGGFEFTPDGNIVLNVAGPVATLQQIAKSIATALKPATALTTQSLRTHVAALPAPAATAVTTTEAVDPTSTHVAAKATDARPTAEANAAAADGDSAPAENTGAHRGPTVSKGGTKTPPSAGSSRTARRAAGAHSGK
jgi:hypothetical protein